MGFLTGTKDKIFGSVVLFNNSDFIRVMLSVVMIFFFLIIYFANSHLINHIVFLTCLSWFYVVYNQQFKILELVHIFPGSFSSNLLRITLSSGSEIQYYIVASKYVQDLFAFINLIVVSLSSCIEFSNSG